ncbi:Oidioi.mRNA.OKI2018_I69.chr1.g759.t1.cds [Oikopleura dioica]|uniref:Transporter n=1 Tax=Oikopleura dioica TaxID=34765 RepID=A0ABN7SPP2_OIKDI|nr:Oidioi.mRNA.OKI2018_I69.chr1.g759.t1.cds [Oikopleura dioica]
MNERRAANLDKFIESGKKVRLPDVIIVGEKKCGTKTLMTFLLEHPQICGFRQEVHFVNTGEIVKDLKALLGHYSSIKNNKSQFLIAKTGFALFKAYLPTVPQNKLKMIEEKYLTETFENWKNRVVFVDIVCDPVKRLLSDFQHYKAEHPNALKMNDHKFGNKSEFSEISFNQFVNTRIKKHINQTDIARSIIRTSTYKFPRTLLKSFPSQLVILDGGVLQKEPWKEMKRLKEKLKWKGLFYEGRFGKREDGFWCVKKDVHLNTKENLIKRERRSSKKNSMTNKVGDSSQGEAWGSHIEFILSCIGYCVGLGNVWRFPYLAYENGGGVFFIPYFLMLFLVGIPLFYTELGMGQFSGEGTLGVWKCLPACKGLGYGMILVSFYVMIYYNVVIAWSIHYLFSGMQKILPWTKCNEWWNTAITKGQCAITASLSENQMNCKANNTDEFETLFWKLNDTVRDEWAPVLVSNYSLSEDEIDQVFNVSTKIASSEEYWFRRVLRVFDNSTDAGEQVYGLGNNGAVLGDLVGCNLFAWILVCACLCKGVQSVGKVVYVTATFPYLVLLILVIFGATLEGAGEGIKFYLKPDIEKLADPKVWSTAASQIFFSLGVSFGGLMVMASYNKFSNNIMRDTFIVALGNCFTSIFAGFGVFSFLGHMAVKNCMSVDSVVESGPGLAFIAYPEAMGLLPASQLFSVLFFIMLITLGLDSQFAFVDILIAGVLDEFPKLRYGWKRLLTVSFFCFLGFLLGFPILTNGGLYWFKFVDNYSAYYGLLLLALFLSLSVHFGYNFMSEPFRFLENMKEMNGNMNVILKGYFYSCWYLLTPGMIIFITAMAFSGYGPIWSGDGKEVYPEWSNGLAMTMSMSPIIVCVPYFIISVIMTKGKSLKPTDDFKSKQEKEGGATTQDSKF